MLSMCMSGIVYRSSFQHKLDSETFEGISDINVEGAAKEGAGTSAGE